jgi:hypothetical protein
MEGRARTCVSPSPCWGMEVIVSSQALLDIPGAWDVKRQP